MCNNPKFICQKQITFSPNQFQLKDNGLKNTMKKLFKGSEKMWNTFLKPAVNLAAPFFGMAFGAKTKNPKIAQATTNILKLISGGRVLNLTDVHGNGLR